LVQLLLSQLLELLIKPLDFIPELLVLIFQIMILSRKCIDLGLGLLQLLFVLVRAIGKLQVLDSLLQNTFLFFYF
jgi:uncharacterized membrane protein YhaH (DUF805 family)